MYQLTHNLKKDLNPVVWEFKTRKEVLIIQEILTSNLKYHNVVVYNEVKVIEPEKLYDWLIANQNRLKLNDIYSKIHNYFAFYQSVINQIEASGNWINIEDAGLKCIDYY